MENSIERGVAVGACALALLLVGCSGAARSTSPDAANIIISYVDTTPPAIEVAATNRLALSAAELVTRDGRVLRMAVSEREAPPHAPAFPPTVGVGVFGGSGGGGGAGIGLGFPLGGFSPAPAPVRAKARLPIEDVESYRRDWRELIVRLRFGTPPGDTSVAELPAPAPRGR